MTDEIIFHDLLLEAMALGFPAMAMAITGERILEDFTTRFIELATATYLGKIWRVEVNSAALPIMEQHERLDIAALRVWIKAAKFSRNGNTNSKAI